MKLIFNKNYFIKLRFFLAVIIAIALIIADSQLGTFIKIRAYMDTIISPFYFLTNNLHQILNNISQILITHNQMIVENQMLYRELLLKNSDYLLLDQYKQENNRLRELLGSPLRQNQQKMVIKVISTSENPYSNQIIVDKGLDDGVYVGQPVISDKGIVGQVIATSKFTSRVLLICDASHAIPIQVLRNGIRMIINGNGFNKDLIINYLPNNIDVRVGDMLVTSGLGGRFPEGYPVAIVSSVKIDKQRAHTIIQAHPTANLQYLNYLLLLWNTNFTDKPTPLPPNAIQNKR